MNVVDLLKKGYAKQADKESGDMDGEKAE